MNTKIDTATSIAEYTETAAALAELSSRYRGVVFDVSTGKGMTEAKAARAELRTYRVNLEKKRVEIKAPALERCRAIDSEAKRITAELSALEDPIDETIKAEEQRKEREREAREAAERERQEARLLKFQAIRELPLKAVNATADEIRAVIAEAEGIDLESFEEGLDRSAATHERIVAIGALRAALDRRLADDAEQDRIKAERAELERLRAVEAERQAESDRLAAAERERVAAEERRKEDQARAEREAIEKAAREAREAEQARIDAERAEQRRKEDAERAEAERKLREEQAKAAAERERLEKEKRAAAKAARDAEIANATLLSAAADAVAFLKDNGHGEHVVTLKLESAIRREPAKQKEAA